jgi:UDP-glucuronate decarboxylase
VVSNFIVQALKGEDITVYGEGTQTRSFCYVDDLVDGMTCLMGAPDAVTGPVNLGNPVEHTILELAEKIIQMSKSSSKVVHKPLPQDDPVRRKPDISLAREKLKWAPSKPLEEGLELTIAYFRSLLG